MLTEKSGIIVQFFEKIMLILNLNFIPASNILFFLGEGFYRNCIGSNTLILFGVKWVFFCNVFLYVKKFFELNAS